MIYKQTSVLPSSVISFLFRIRIAPRAVVCVESKLKGTINIGCMTIIHPSASIIAVAGPVTIKEGNIIEEKAAIIHK